MKATLNLEYFRKKDQSHSLSITKIINCETGSYLNLQKAIFHATLRQTRCYRFPNTAEISTEPVSYHSSNNLRYWEYEKVAPSQINDCRLQVFSSELGPFLATSSKADNSETENFFWIFDCVSEIYVKFEVFSRKRTVS